MPLTDAHPDEDVPPADRASVDLVSAVDDEADPTQLTVYSDRDDEITTHWITVDLDHAVDLAEMV
jgi:hypothetical protein